MTLQALVHTVKARQMEAETRPSASFAELLEALYQAGFTGRVYVDFGQGVPTHVSLPNPIGVKIQRN